MMRCADRRAWETAAKRAAFVILSGCLGSIAYGLTSKRPVTAWPALDAVVMSVTVLCLTGLVFVVTLHATQHARSDRP